MIVQIQNIKQPAKVKKYWRSASQLANSEKYQDWLHREFPEGASELPEGESRRNLLKFMGATLALAGLTACRRPEEKIVPLAKGVEDLVPGKPLHYSSVFTMAGSVAGVTVETHDGRPTKIEGNPNHSQSLGAASAFAQASILGLYDPDRIAEHKKDGSTVSWDDFISAVPELFPGDGAGVRFLTERIPSPSFERLRSELRQKMPEARFVQYEAISGDSASEGARIAFGRPVAPNYVFDQADVILSLDFDFIGLDATTILNMRQWASRRRVEDHHDEMSRVYTVESQFSLTGAAADHRLRMRSADVMPFALLVASKLGLDVPAPANIPGGEKTEKFADVVARDLLAHRGKALVAAGPRQPAALHALSHLINQALGNLGRTVILQNAPDTPGELAQLKELVDELNSGSVKTVVVLGGNPVYDAPADLRFGDAIAKAQNRIYHGLDNNETASACNWILQGAHYLESWGDARSFDGVASIQQPMIQPLFDGKSPLELLATILGSDTTRGYEILQKTWLDTFSGDKQKAWRKALHDGVIEGTASATVSASVNQAGVLQAVRELPSPTAGDGYELVFVPSSHAYDGRYNNNAWMQEAPDPITKITWDNVALISQATARKLGLNEHPYQIETPRGVSLRSSLPFSAVTLRCESRL
jgi:MoCo/4Fe-4S cofactor protein with predicted Tat translocation signal